MTDVILLKYAIITCYIVALFVRKKCNRLFRKQHYYKLY